MNSRALASLLLGLLISAVCLWYAFSGVNLAAVARGISRVGTGWVLGSVLCGLLSLVVRAVRWRLLLEGIKPVSIGSLVSATFIGITANNLLPARLGEVVRAWVLARRERTLTSTVLASILVERLLDVMAALALLGLCLAVAPDLDGGATSFLKRTGLLVLSLALACGVVLMAAVRFRKRLFVASERWATQVGRAWVSRGLELLHRFLEGLGGLRGGTQAVAVSGLSLLIWALSIASFFVLAKGFGMGLTMVQATLVFVIVLFGIAIPSAPGFVGTFHGFCVAGLAMVAGTEPTVAAAYATLLHGSQWLGVTAVGLACLLADRSVTWAGVAGLVKQG